VGRRDGVEVRPTSIRLFFVDANGEHCRETLKVAGKPLKPTAANIAHARRVADRIRRDVELGTFNLAEHFPHSKRAAEARALSFGALADNWLDSKGHLADATRNQYQNAIAFWKELLGEGSPIERFTHDYLAKKIGSYPWASAKLRNNYLIALRGAVGLHFHGRRALDNPMGGITNQRTVKRLPDPLTLEERDMILADMSIHYDPRVCAYFTFAFFTGMRPEELIALRWEDIDWRSAVARVERVRTFKGSERDGTKTGTGRDVDLVPPAIAALKVMKAYTFLKRDDDDREVDIFENPFTGRAWHDERSQRDHYWTPTLKRLGIRHRRAYCTRHTYCTAALMAGIKPAYIASQAGHSVKMLLDTYARWIPGADAGSEKQRLALAMAGTSLALPQGNRSAGA
jgi:integrase